MKLFPEVIDLIEYDANAGNISRAQAKRALIVLKKAQEKEDKADAAVRKPKPRPKDIDSIVNPGKS